MSRFRHNRVLVTGGCGFIGSHLVEALTAAGAIVTVVDNLQSGKWANLCAVSKCVRMVEGDIRDSTSIKGIVGKAKPKYVFHLAANASVPKSVDNPAYDFETNCGGTFNVLNALREIGGCEEIVVASSGAVYGEPGSFPIREEDPLKPISPYGASKANAEICAQMFQAVYGLPVVVARIFNTYGPRMARFVILDFLKKLDRDPYRLEILGTGRQVRDFTYVADTVEGLLLLGAHGVPGEAYNISSGMSCSVTELAHQLLAALGLEGRTTITFTGTSWVGDAQRWQVSIDKIARLGYACHVALEQGLRQTIEWYHASSRKNGDEPSAGAEYLQ